MIHCDLDNRMTEAGTLDILRSHSLSDAVRVEIERLIVAGDIAPGESLREQALAQRLGVSRGPVREAIRALEARELVTIVKHCGATVRCLDVQEAEHLYDMRGVLEAAIGERAAQRTDGCGLANLERQLAQMTDAVSANDAATYGALNLQFHDSLAQASGNPRLHENYRRVVAGLALLRRYAHARSPTALERSLHEHTEILAMIAARRSQDAARLLAAHSVQGRLRLQEALAGTDTIHHTGPEHDDTQHPG